MNAPGTESGTEAAAAAVVSCAGVSKSFGTVAAITHLTLDVEAGEIVVLLGPSGCGKTTFLRLVAGFERPDAGSIVLAGETVAAHGLFVSPERRRVGFVFQDYALFPHLSVAANVGFGVERGSRVERIARALEMVGLKGHGDRYPHELSGGQQQRVALARAIAPQPGIVLLDEPFSNLDADLRARVRDEVRQILRHVKATAVFVTHDQEEAFAIADRIAVLNEGRIEQVGRPEEIYRVPETRFVADFVGEAAFLPATIVEGRVDTELGSFDLMTRPDRGPAEIMVRPEDVDLLSTQEPGAGEVIDRRFQGPLTLSTVGLPSGRIVTSAHSSRRRFSDGEKVEVRFRPDHVVLFRGDRRLPLGRADRDHYGGSEGR